MGTDTGEDEFFMKPAFALWASGAHLRLLVFDCPISSTFSFPPSPIPSSATPVVQAIPFLFVLEAFS